MVTNQVFRNADEATSWLCEQQAEFLRELPSMKTEDEVLTAQWEIEQAARTYESFMASRFFQIVPAK